jgi:hypothetical protein
LPNKGADIYTDVKLLLDLYKTVLSDEGGEIWHQLRNAWTDGEKVKKAAEVKAA